MQKKNRLLKKRNQQLNDSCNRKTYKVRSKKENV